jgi:hypothetical protein
VYRTTVDKDTNLQEGSLNLSSKGHIIDELPVRSVTTYIIDGVSPLSIPASGSIVVVDGHCHRVRVGASERITGNHSVASLREGLPTIRQSQMIYLRRWQV